MINIDTIKCTMCGSCIQICPKDCIHIGTDEFGFEFPYVNNELCVNCEKCGLACPIDNTNYNRTKSVFAAINKDSTELAEETSGGIFGAIANAVISNGGIVYGCTFSENLRAEHIRVDNKENLKSLYGSKYVLSYTNNTFRAVKKDLESGKKVLYCSTPCQIAGLYAFLKTNYDNLITIDLICHGVSSQNYFKKSLEVYRNKEVKYISFRDKKNSGWSCSGIIKYTKKNKTYIKPYNYFDNYYYYYYLSGYTYRSCCYDCKYAAADRVGDITLGDLWGAEAFDLKFNPSNGCSLVLVNTDKGESVFKNANVDFSEISVAEAIKFNEQLRRPAVMPAIRLELLKQYSAMSAEQIQKHYKQKFFVKRMISKMKYKIPYWMRAKINKYRFKK